MGDASSEIPPEDRSTGEAAQGRLVPMRLQKFLARAGAASRRGSEDLMTAGRVAVNGVVVTELGAKVDPAVDTVSLDGRVLSLGEMPAYLALNKPLGVVTTMSDPQGRTTVADLVPVSEHPGLFPIGRLDADTTGLLLFTTDGELAHRLLHPRWHVEKVYLSRIDGTATDRMLAPLRVGIRLDDGVTSPARLTVLGTSGGTTRVEIAIAEGRKRQVRRMFSALHHPVLELHRETFGPVGLGGLAPGAFRHLSNDEVSSLRAAVSEHPE
jgi:23S rRNA pseudouridine2605 synthase